MFANAEVDATGVDFSDRIARKRKSYIVSTRRRRHAAATDAPSDDEGWEGEPETVTQRLARLRREVEELRVQISEKKGEVIGDADEVDQESVRQARRGRSGGERSISDVLSVGHALERDLLDPLVRGVDGPSKGGRERRDGHHSAAISHHLTVPGRRAGVERVDVWIKEEK